MNETPTSELFELLNQQLNDEQWDEAFETLKTLFEREKTHISLWFYLGELCQAHGCRADADFAYSLALACNEGDVIVRRARAYERYADRRFGDALLDLEYLLRHHLVSPQSEMVLRLRADIYWELERYEWALQDLTDAVAHFPENVSGREWRDELSRRMLHSRDLANALGAHLDAHQQRREAAEKAEPLDDLPPLNPDFADDEPVVLACRHANALDRAGQENEADEIYRFLANTHDESHVACYYVGQGYLRRLNLGNARYWLERALALAPGDGETLGLLARLEEEWTRREDAASHQEAAWRFRLFAASSGDEASLFWLQKQWDDCFFWLGEIGFLPEADEAETPESQSQLDALLQGDNPEELGRNIDDLLDGKKTDEED